MSLNLKRTDRYRVPPEEDRTRPVERCALVDIEYFYNKFLSPWYIYVLFMRTPSGSRHGERQKKRNLLSANNLHFTSRDPNNVKMG